MTLRAAELAFNLWAIGLPVVIVTGSLLRLLHRAPARARYLLVVAAFILAATLPFAAEKEQVLVNATAPIAREASRLPLAWPAIAIVLLLRDAIGHLRLRRLRRTWEPASDALKALLEWPASIPLAVDRNAPPMTTGLVAPRVVLPANIAEAFPLDVARRIARHELAHRTWRDPLVFAAMRAVASLLWLAPLWPLLRWARREREAAADEAALRSASREREDYVAALLAIAKNPLRRTLALRAAGSDLEFRARRIFAMPQSRLSMAVAAMTLFAGLALAKRIEPMALAVRGEPSPIVATPTSVHIDRHVTRDGRRVVLRNVIRN
ncbi:MAG TPA: M56 family metallopeptidase [Thermoanaerobaculia bacterium]|jgi:hypothetical protein